MKDKQRVDIWNDPSVWKNCYPKRHVAYLSMPPIGSVVDTPDYVSNDGNIDLFIPGSEDKFEKHTYVRKFNHADSEHVYQITTEAKSCLVVGPYGEPYTVALNDVFNLYTLADGSIIKSKEELQKKFDQSTKGWLPLISRERPDRRLRASFTSEYCFYGRDHFKNLGCFPYDYSPKSFLDRTGIFIVTAASDRMPGLPAMDSSCTYIVPAPLFGLLYNNKGWQEHIDKRVHEISLDDLPKVHSVVDSGAQSKFFYGVAQWYIALFRSENYICKATAIQNGKFALRVRENSKSTTEQTTLYFGYDKSTLYVKGKHKGVSLNKTYKVKPNLESEDTLAALLKCYFDICNIFKLTPFRYQFRYMFLNQSLQEDLKQSTYGMKVARNNFETDCIQGANASCKGVLGVWPNKEKTGKPDKTLNFSMSLTMNKAALSKVMEDSTQFEAGKFIDLSIKINGKEMFESGERPEYRGWHALEYLFVGGLGWALESACREVLGIDD